MKYFRFLRSREYRRTFFLYLAIALIFSAVTLSLFFQNITIAARDRFDRETSDLFLQTDRKAWEITDSIDRFLAQLYASPGRLEDFFMFFGATAEDYMTARLDSPLYLDETYLSSCNSLVYSSQYSIRHMLYYSNQNYVDMEYSSSGYSRHHIITNNRAREISREACVYAKDIHQNSALIGKIGFVLDLSSAIRSDFTASANQAVYLLLPDSAQRFGSLSLSDDQLRAITGSGKVSSQITIDGIPFYYTLHTSDQLPFSLLYLAPRSHYLKPQMGLFYLLCSGLFLVFGAIALVLVLRFSRDDDSIARILDSMKRAARSDFTPVAITTGSEGFGAIAAGLNRLYANLDSLIQQEYKLTISQQRTQMDMLSTQLNPHFLYNTLERIRMRAVLENAPDVAEATAGLGLLYRNIVKTDPVITIEKELEITRQYLDLMTFLYGDQFLYHLDVAPEIATRSTPKIWMQPIAENFFKHNFKQDEHLKVIVIEAESLKNGFEFCFFDNIGHMEDDKLQELNRDLETADDCSTGIGLRNVLHRLQLYYGSGVSMRIENNDPAGICIRVTITEEEALHVQAADRRRRKRNL